MYFAGALEKLNDVDPESDINVVVGDLETHAIDPELLEVGSAPVESDRARMEFHERLWVCIRSCVW